MAHFKFVSIHPNYFQLSQCQKDTHNNIESTNESQNNESQNNNQESNNPPQSRSSSSSTTRNNDMIDNFSPIADESTRSSGGTTIAHTSISNSDQIDGLRRPTNTQNSGGSNVLHGENIDENNDDSNRNRLKCVCGEFLQLSTAGDFLIFKFFFVML